jgi:hypothetical protein
VEPPLQRMTIVYIKLPVEAGFASDPNIPFMVWTPDYPERLGMYEREPHVIAQMSRGEKEATFEAEWINGEWIFGRRLYNA